MRVVKMYIDSEENYFNFYIDLPSDTAGMKPGRHAKTWSVATLTNVRHVFLQKKNKLAGKRAQKISIRITKTNTVISDYYQPYFTNNSVKIPLKYHKNVHLAKMAPRKE